MNRRSFLLSTAALTACTHVGDGPWATRYAGDEVYQERLQGIPKTLICHLHAWSSVYTEASTWPQYKNLDSVCIICPNFGGPNNHSRGAGTAWQTERIKRVIDKAVSEHSCQRVLLSAYSGGMSLSVALMAAYPGLVYGAVLWNGPTDYAAWYSENAGHRAELEACFGGTPAQVGAAYAARSPITVATGISGVRITINYGTSDTEVLPHHSTDIAAVLNGANTVTLLPFSGGHVFLPAVAMPQLQGLLL